MSAAVLGIIDQSPLSANPLSVDPVEHAQALDWTALEGKLQPGVSLIGPSADGNSARAWWEGTAAHLGPAGRDRTVFRLRAERHFPLSH